VLVDHRRDLHRLPVDGRVELKSNAHTTFGASASICGTDEQPARLRGECQHLCSPSSHQSRCTLFLFIGSPHRGAALPRHAGNP
jgi:hypothetical protein